MQLRALQPKSPGWLAPTCWSVTGWLVREQILIADCSSK
jgi:hypothetical protein